jgi:hypothetical protein
MDAIGNYLFGTNPKVVQEPSTSTVSGPQNYLIQQLQGLFSNDFTNGSSYSQPLTAQITEPQQESLNAIGATGSAVAGVAPQTVAGLGASTASLEKVASTTPADFTSYFNNSVVAPLMNSFTSTTIPALQEAYGASSGGTQSSNYQEGVTNATKNLEQTIADDASSTALTQYQNNQQNTLEADAALGQNATTAANIQGGVLNEQALPQTTQQETYTNQYQEFLNALSQQNTITGQASSLATAPTVQQGNTIAESGTSGLIQGLVEAIGSRAGGSGGGK